MNKERLRINIKARKSLLSESERLQAAAAAFARLEESVAFIMADHVLLYHSLPDELSTIEFLDKWHEKKHFYLPRVNGVNLELLPYDRHRLHLGSFSIEEPVGNDTVDISQIELIIVPSVAFDREGNRLGRGKGFYDRLLSNASATKIGIGYDFQLVDEIETEAHDVPLDIIITDRRYIRPRRK